MRAAAQFVQNGEPPIGSVLPGVGVVCWTGEAMIGEGIARAMMGAFIAVIVVTASATAALIFGVPWLWSVVKPLLHAVTA